jgi:hypothetical protein
LYNGYFPSDGTQGAYITWRWSLGPFGSIHDYNILYRTGPDYGRASVYLASIPEDDPASGAADDRGVLQSIDTLNYVKAFEIDAYSPALTRNVHRAGSWGASFFRIMGQVGDPLTAAVFDNQLGVYNLDGGPGPYAVKLLVDAKGGASTGYKFDIQAFHRKRTDWSWG